MNQTRQKTMQERLRDRRGAVMLISYIIVVAMMILGGALVLLNINERRVAERTRRQKVVMYAAEAGIERALYDLREDFENDTTSPSWTDDDINGMIVLDADLSAGWTAVPYTGTTINGVTYAVQMRYDAGGSSIMEVRSTATEGDITQQILAHVRMTNISPWSNAIFAGGGAAGAMVNGNVNIYGSVHILGDNLDPTDLVVDLGGTAELIGNNYSQLENGLRAKVPALDTVVFGGESVETLNAELRVKVGIVGLSGNSAVGQPDQTGNAYKETVDGVYVTDGFGGNKGTANVHSDNGWSSAYDLGDAVSFPSLSDPYGGYSSYQAYLADSNNSLVISDEADLAKFENLTPGSNFTITDGTNSIAVDGSGHITINGSVYLDNTTYTDKGDLNMSGGDFTYSGKGTIFVPGNAQINSSLETVGNTSFPNNIMGVMTPNDIGFNAANINVMGLFYAENTIKVEKQTDLIGTIVSNYFDLGTNVPSIYQVPDTTDHLPDGMIGQGGVWLMTVVSWQKL